MAMTTPARGFLYRNYRISAYPAIPDKDGNYNVSYYYYTWEPAFNDMFGSSTKLDRGMVYGKIPAFSSELIPDTTGRLSAEVFASREFDGWQHAWYKGHRVRVGSGNLKYGYYSAQYKVPDGEDVPEDVNWLVKPVHVYAREFWGDIPASEAQNLTFEAEQIWKMAFYKGFWTLVESRKDDRYTIRIAIPYREMSEELDWLKTFQAGYGTIPVTDPDLYIDDLGVIREDLLTKTFPVNWREATYKGFPVKVGAHSDTHHFATHHADVLLPRGALPSFLQPATDQPPYAIQTGPQDFMAKIAIDDPELKFAE